MNQNEILKFLIEEYETNKEAWFTVSDIHDKTNPKGNIRATREKIGKMFRNGLIIMDGKSIIKAFFKGQRVIRRYKIDTRSINSSRKKVAKSYSDISALGNTNMSKGKFI